uniref:interleukin-17F-like n=1 Tax=Myxine glutinosa TaxID=7769 RepID=UPI00359000BE
MASRHIVLPLFVGLLVILAELEAREHHDRRNKQKSSSIQRNDICLRLELPQGQNKQSTPSWNVRNINIRSLSPWNYSMSYDKNRTPQMLWNATCLRQHCLGHTYNSVPIVHYTQVLYRSGKHFYLSMEPLVVGCTCVEPQRRSAAM